MTDKIQNNQDTDMNSSEPELVSQFEAVHDRLGTLGIRVSEAHAHLSALRSLSHDESEIKSEVAEAEAEALVRQLESLQDELESAIDISVAAASEIENGDQTEDSGNGSSVTHPDMLWNSKYRRYPPLRSED